MGAGGFLPHRVPELPQALLTWPAVVTLKVIPEEVKASGLLHVHEMRFLGMQPEPSRRGPALYERERLLRILRGAAQDDKIIRIAHHLVARRGHDVVERVEIEIGEQGTDQSPNAKGTFQFERVVERWRSLAVLDLRRK